VSDIFKVAKEKYDSAESHWREIYNKAESDLDFLSDDEDAQWNKSDYASRKALGRPTITIDQLAQFTHQVVNSIRMNTPTINVIPAGKEGDEETAGIFKGLIKNIEYISAADDAYDQAALNAVRCSIGFIRIDHDYVDDESFEQELLIKRVINPLSVYLDPESVEPDGSDAKFGFITESISAAKFKKRYPGKNPISFEDANKENRKDKSDDDNVLIVEYFYIDEEEKEIGLNEQGDKEDYTEGKEYKTRRKVKKKTVKRVRLSGEDVLEETTFPGKYIPLIPVYGEECWRNGERHLMSLIRRAKPAQMMLNLWKSIETEILINAPKAPVMVAEGSIEEYAADWKDPSKSMALRYKTTGVDGQPIPQPTRLAPPQIPTGIVNASQQSTDDIKSAIGMYNASLGQKSNETSGVAISQRKEEGSTATYHFGDNLTKSVAHVGRVLVCAIPQIYDSARVIRIIGEEDEIQAVGINGELVEKQERPFDLSQGIYDVKVVTGAPFTTRRQEAAQFFHDIVTRQPELMSVMGDLLFKNMDFTGAPAMAERMKKIIKAQNPDLIEDDEQEVDPEKMQMAQALEQSQMQLQEMQQQMQAMQAELQSKQQAEVMKAQEAVQKAQIEMEKLRLQEKEGVTEAEIKQAELRLKERELALKEAEFQARVEFIQEFGIAPNSQPLGGSI
jgi:hypothetical protein